MLELNESPALTVLLRESFLTLYGPPFQGTTVVFEVYGHGTEKSWILTPLSLF